MKVAARLIIFTTSSLAADPPLQNIVAGSVLQAILPPPPNDIAAAMDARDEARFLLIDAQAGDSNRMLAIASGVGIAAAANRTVLLPWGEMFKGNRFGNAPPPGLHDWNLPTQVDPRCFIEMSFRAPHRPCWAPLIDFYAATAGNATKLTQFMRSCKVIHFRSEQYTLPLALPFHVHGRPLRNVLLAYGHAPMATLTAALFRPNRALLSAVEGFHHLQEQLLTRTATQTKEKNTPPRQPFLITVHLRSVILNSQFPNQGHRTIPAFVKCVSDWAIATKATHIYIASDNGKMVKTVEDMVRANLSLGQTASLSPVTFLTFLDFEAYALHSDTVPQSNNGHLEFGDLAESLILGRGNVCIGTPRSTFSKVATNWWNASFCEVIVDAGAPDQGCTVVGRHPWATTQTSSDHRNSQIFNNMTASDNVVGEGFISGRVAQDIFACDGITCPNPPVVSAKQLRSSCPHNQGARRLRKGGSSVPSKCCHLSL